jgi:cytochrome c2
MRLSTLLLATTLPTLILTAAGVARAVEAGDPALGKKVFAKCQACHSLEAGKNKVGPTLHGVMGRASASEAEFKYSDAMKNAHLTWDAETLDKYLAKPKDLVPGTKMAFPGLPKEKDRADLISYLEQAAGSAQ